MKKLGWIFFLLSCGSETLQTSNEHLNISDGNLNVSFKSYALIEFDNDSKPILKIIGSSNLPLNHIFSWVPDDAFGEAQLLNEHQFQIILHGGYEANSILSGLPLQVMLQSDQTYNLRITLQPQFKKFSGSHALFIEKNIQPIFVRDENNLRYRATVQTPTDHIFYDLTYQALEQAAWFEEMHFNIENLRKKAEVVFKINQADITTEDPYTVWPTDICQPDVLACLQQNMDDLGPCGPYREVQKCWRLSVD